MGVDSKKIQEELQFLLEEDSRVITYKFVSANFGIHVNDAKRHLQALLGVCRSKGDDDVTATFYLSGVSDQQGDYVSQKSLVVSEDRLAAARDSLTAVTSEHVFSLQRHRVSDTTVLYGADQQERQADPAAYNSHGAITNSRAELIPEAELLKARKATVPPIAQPPKRPAAPATAPAIKKEPVATDAEKSSENPPANQKAKANGHDKAEEGEKTKLGKVSTSKGSASIASMFAKAGTEKKTTKSPPKKSAGGGMMNSFLKKGAEQKPSASVGDTGSAAPAPAPAAASEKPDSPAVKTEPEETVKTVRFGAKKSATTSSSRKGPTVRGKRPRKGDSSSAGPAKQRRRIQVLASDSDSSDDDGGRDEEEPEPEPVAPPPPESDEEEEPKSAPQQSRRKRKLVTKTFVDEEGFMVTKKEYESCSGSETEESPAQNDTAAKENPKAAPTPAPAPAPAEAAKPPKAKEATQHKVKQAGIMSFFKKK